MKRVFYDNEEFLTKSLSRNHQLRSGRVFLSKDSYFLDMLIHENHVMLTLQKSQDQSAVVQKDAGSK